jgi:hypothetical protein
MSFSELTGGRASGAGVAREVLLDHIRRQQQNGTTGDTQTAFPAVVMLEKQSKTSIRKLVATASVVLSAAFAVAACGGDDDGKGSGTRADLPQGSESVDLDPADSTTRVDNPYRPMAPGSRRVYRDTDSDGTVAVPASSMG